MSHTLETAITFPIVFSVIVFLVAAGPILYEQTADAASFQTASIRQSIDNRSIYVKNTILYEDEPYPVVNTSPEQMHSFVRAIEDSGKILIKGVMPS